MLLALLKGNSSENAERAANAREEAGKIISSLISMGMPADRLSVTDLAVASVEDTEVRVYTDSLEFLFRQS